MQQDDADRAEGARLRVAFVPGVTPDKWFRIWEGHHPDVPLVPVPLEDDAGQIAVLEEGRADMLLARLPVDRDRHRLIPLYDETMVVLAAKGHVIEAAEHVAVAELAGEHLLQHPDDVPEWRDVADEVADGTRADVPHMTPREIVQTVAAGAGIAIVPLSVARQFERKDVVRRPVTDVPPRGVGLCWPVPSEAETDELEQRFVNVVRGRSAHSSRDAGVREREQQAAQERAGERKRDARQSAADARGKRRADRRRRAQTGGNRGSRPPGSRRGGPPRRGRR